MLLLQQVTPALIWGGSGNVLNWVGILVQDKTRKLCNEFRNTLVMFIYSTCAEGRCVSIKLGLIKYHTSSMDIQMFYCQNIMYDNVVQMWRGSKYK